MANDYEWQLNIDLAPEWGGSYTVRVGKSRAEVGNRECACIIQDSLPDPSAEAYHATLANGAPIAYFRNDSELEESISHELCETAVDPAANRFAVKADSVTVQALESCDRVQGSPYKGKNGTTLANFLLQAAFDPGAPAPYDFCGVLGSGEARTPDGYEIDGSITGEHDAFGTRRELALVGTVTASRLERLAHPMSRAHRRGLRVSGVREALGTFVARERETKP